MVTGPKSHKSRRNFTLPEDFEAKIEELMELHGISSKKELLRQAINKMAATFPEMEKSTMVPRDSTRPEVFLCHSSKDKAYVRRLASDLDMLGVEPWFDAWQLSVGDSLIKRIGEGIEQSKYFCLVLSKNSQNSRWCDTELSEALSTAIERGRQNIFLVKKGQVPLPPFVRDNFHVDAPKYSIRTAIQIASRVYGISPKDVDIFFEEVGRPSREDALEFISTASKPDTIAFGSSDWKALKRTLLENDIEIGDSIRIHDLRSGQRFDAC